MATEQGFPLWRAWGTIYRGWVKVKNGDVAEGISLLRSGSTAYRATGAEAWRTHNIALLAGAYEIAGQVEEAVTLLDEALQIAGRTGERWREAELNRHKGQLRLRQGYADAAEELYSRALSVSREQGAKLWELRATVSLSRLRRDQGRCPEPAICLHWSTAGSPKASTHPSSKRQKRYSTTSRRNSIDRCVWARRPGRPAQPAVVIPGAGCVSDAVGFLAADAPIIRDLPSGKWTPGYASFASACCRGDVADGGMDPRTIVIASDISEQVAPRSIAIGVFAVVDQLGFQSAERSSPLAHCPSNSPCGSSIG